MKDGRGRWWIAGDGTSDVSWWNNNWFGGAWLQLWLVPKAHRLGLFLHSPSGVGIGYSAQVIEHAPSSAQRSTRALSGEHGYFSRQCNRLTYTTRGEKNRYVCQHSLWLHQFIFLPPQQWRKANIGIPRTPPFYPSRRSPKLYIWDKFLNTGVFIMNHRPLAMWPIAWPWHIEHCRHIYGIYYLSRKWWTWIIGGSEIEVGAGREGKTSGWRGGKRRDRRETKRQGEKRVEEKWLCEVIREENEGGGCHHEGGENLRVRGRKANVFLIYVYKDAYFPISAKENSYQDMLLGYKSFQCAQSQQTISINKNIQVYSRAAKRATKE